MTSCYLYCNPSIPNEVALTPYICARKDGVLRCFSDKILGLTNTFEMKMVNEKNLLAVIAELLEPKKQSAFGQLFDRFNAK